MTTLNPYSKYFVPTYSNFPQGKYITLVLARWIESEAIFRTEGSGQPLNKEFVFAGTADSDEPIQRIVISKRKQTAVERRTGRELLRNKGLLFEAKKGAGICALNRNNPCEKCLDCMIYGYAAGGGGAQRSRVITDDAFSLNPAHQIIDEKTFNAPFDNSTPWDRDDKKQMTGLGSDEYVKPESVFLDMETIKDVTEDEFKYILGNILRSSRYGAISSRIGKVKNVLLGVVFSDCELFSNLELTQTVFDNLKDSDGEIQFPIGKTIVHQAVQSAIPTLSKRVMGATEILSPASVTQLTDDLISLYADEEAIKQLLEATGKIYTP
jgi:CRISPR-associated protein Csc2